VRLSGKNFQSWAEFDLEIDGLTIVTGPSDVGKSALFRALKGVLRNELPAEFVRNGQDEPMEVRVDVGGHTVSARRKRKGSTTYVIDGRDFAKLAGGIPEELKSLKLGEIAIGDFDFDPIFGRQNSAQFLIDPLTYKPTEVNAILGAFGGTDKLEAGKKEANLRKTQGDSEARAIAAQMREAEERKAKLFAMRDTGLPLSESLDSLSRDIDLLETNIEWLEASIGYRREIAKYRRFLDALVPPDTTGLADLSRLANFAEQAALASSYAKWLWKPQLAITSVVADWGDARLIWAQIVALETAVEAGRHVVSTDKLKDSLASVEAIFNRSVGLWRSINALESLSVLLGEVAGSAERLAGVETELSAAQAELKKGLCPKCGKPLEHQCI
jgi:DNA repair exonuclease SbcCD ATPase subunit